MLHSRRAEILFTRNWQLLYTLTKMNPCHWGTYRPFLNPSCSLLHGGCLFFLSPWIISRMLWYRNFAGNWQDHCPTLGLYSLRLPFLTWTYVFHSVRISSIYDPAYTRFLKRHIRCMSAVVCYLTKLLCNFHSWYHRFDLFNPSDILFNYQKGFSHY